MLGCFIRIVTTEINVGFSDLVKKMAFTQYSSQIMASWRVVGVGQNEIVGVIAALEMF